MEKTLVLVGMKDYKTAAEFMAVVMSGLRQDGISTKFISDIRMTIETPHAQIRFIYNPEYQQLHGLKADVVFGFPEYTEPLRPYVKRCGFVQPPMGLREWIVTHEKSCEDRDRYVRQDVATAEAAGAIQRLTTALERLGKPAIPEIKIVHFSGPVTCVIWADGTKTLVRCGENDVMDPEKGLALAIAKKALGTNESGSNYYDIFKKYLPKPEVAEEVVPVETEVLYGEDLKASVDEVTPDE